MAAADGVERERVREGKKEDGRWSVVGWRLREGGGFERETELLFFCFCFYYCFCWTNESLPSQSGGKGVQIKVCQPIFFP